MEKPKTIWLSLTDICNNQCKWCYDLGNHSSKFKYMNFDHLISIIETIQTLEVKKCILIGGEPTLHPEFYKIVAFLKQKGLKVSVVTNGLQFDEKHIKDIKQSSVDSIVISIHGWTSEKYFELTGNKNGFQKLEKSIRLLQDSKIKFGINIVISKFTQGQSDEIINFLLAYDLKNVSFNIASPIVSRNGVDSIATGTMECYKEQILELQRKCVKNKIKTSFLLIIPHCVFTKEELKELSSNSTITSGCQVLHGRGVVFKTNGAIATCTHLTDFEIADNIQTIKALKTSSSFLQFWNSNELDEIRKLANRFRFPQCKSCSHWKVCGGGCMVHWALNEPGKIKINNLDI